jgi:glycosyltransferase involved in cell wall biosynthesis
MKTRPRLLRITTVPISLKLLLQGQLSFFQSQNFEVLAVSADGPEIESLRKEGIAHEIVPMTRKITLWQDLVCLFKLISIIRTFKPDIVHTHTPKAGLLGMLAAWLCRVPVRMHTVAGLPLMERSGIVKQILILTERITYACAHRVYPNSTGLKTYIQGFSNTKNLFVIGRGSSNGIDTNFFNSTSDLRSHAAEIRRTYNIRESDIVFSFVGRIVKDKGISPMVEAFKKIIQDENNGISAPSNAYLLLVGTFEQDLDPISQQDYDFLKSHPRVILAGFQKDIRPWLLASNIFVFPSYREGFPNVVMQACALGIPSIVSDINGCNEIIQHGKTGLIVSPKNADDLYQAMIQLAADKSLQLRFSEYGRAYVTHNFDRQYIWQELMKEYKILMDKHSRVG